MNIAVASHDGVSISRHFGRSKCFLVFEVEDNTIVGRSVRDNNSFADHARGQCADGAHHDRPHSHAGIVAVMSDCEAVLCYGMGRRAAEDLKRNGIQAFILQQELSPEDAVRAYIEGDLEAAGDFCQCHE